MELSNRAFPNGTTVEAYPESDWAQGDRPPVGAPAGTPADSGVVAGGTVTLDVSPGTYYAYAEVAGEHRYVRFIVEAAASSSAFDRSELWLPDGAVQENVPFRTASTNASITSGRLQLAGGLVARAGEEYTGLAVHSGSTGATAPTNHWMALIDRATRAVLAISADKGAEAWAANTRKEFLFSEPYTSAEDRAVYAAILVVAGTPPNLSSVAIGTTALANTSPQTSGHSSASLTDPASCPDPIAAISGSSPMIYANLLG